MKRPAKSANTPIFGSPVSLDKGGQASISMDKQDRVIVLTATLEWDGGSDRRRQQGADLDLYALFVPASKALRGPLPAGTVVKRTHRPQGTPLDDPDPDPDQAVADTAAQSANTAEDGDVVYYKQLGSLDTSPYIQHYGDVRGPGRETVRITRPDRHGYVLLCAYSALSNGFGSFYSFGAKAVISDRRGSTVTVPLFKKARTRFWVAMALVDFTTAEGVVIRHIEAYGGRTERRPVLNRDGTILLNAGPAGQPKP